MLLGTQQLRSCEWTCVPVYTPPVRALFFFKSIWMRPQAYLGCQKNQNFWKINWKQLSFCVKIALEKEQTSKNFQNWNKMSKNPVFLEFFKYSSIWGKSYHTKPQMVCLVDTGASFDNPGVSRSGSIYRRSSAYAVFWDFWKTTV